MQTFKQRPDDVIMNDGPYERRFMRASIKPDPAKVEAALAKTRQRLERKPTHWLRLEQAGRCLRWLDDPQASAYLARAIEHFPLREGDPGSYMRLGAIYRLYGARDDAREAFQTARALYAPRVLRDDPDDIAVEHMIFASYLAGHDKEVHELAEKLRNLVSDSDLLAYAVAKLAAARRTGDAALAEGAVGEIASWIRRERVNVWDGGGVLLWDWYEIALDLHKSLSDGG